MFSVPQKATRRVSIPHTCRPRVVVEPGMRRSLLHGNREVSIAVPARRGRDAPPSSACLGPRRRSLPSKEFCISPRPTQRSNRRPGTRFSSPRPRRASGSTTFHWAAFGRSRKSRSVKARSKGTFAFWCHLLLSRHVHLPRSLMALVRMMPLRRRLRSRSHVDEQSHRFALKAGTPIWASIPFYPPGQGCKEQPTPTALELCVF